MLMVNLNLHEKYSGELCACFSCLYLVLFGKMVRLPRKKVNHFFLFPILIPPVGLLGEYINHVSTLIPDFFAFFQVNRTNCDDFFNSF